MRLAGEFGESGFCPSARQRPSTQHDRVGAAKTRGNVHWTVNQPVGKDRSRQQGELVRAEVWQDEAR